MMCRRSRADRRSACLVGVVLGASVLVVGAAPAAAQVPALPVVSVVAMPFIIDATAYVDCDGVQHAATPPHGFLLLARDDPPSSAQEPVDVGVTFSGDLADDVVGAPASVTVEAGNPYPSVSFDLPVDASGSLTVGLAPGAGYEVGDPSSASATVAAGVDVVADCTDPLDLPAEVVDQSIAVGEKPVDLPLTIDTIFFGYRVIGDLPPGLVLGPGYRWQGAATTPGTYALTVRVCDLLSRPGLPEDVRACVGTAEVRIVVEGPAGPAPSTPTAPAAPAATPVSAAARLTG